MNTNGGGQLRYCMRARVFSFGWASRGEGGDEEDEGGMKPKDQGWVIRYLDKHPRLHKAQRASGGYLLMVLRL